MISIHKIEVSETAYQTYCENLLVASFPEEERRELAQYREIVSHVKTFVAHIILDENQPSGLINIWNFDDFIFIEHFAIAPEMRNKGIGQQVLKIITKNQCLPIVLEVELPSDEISQRRIRFYEREGFRLLEHDYKQPPYRKGQNYIPMKLMAYQNRNTEIDPDKIQTTLYHDVYFI